MAQKRKQQRAVFRRPNDVAGVFMMVCITLLGREGLAVVTMSPAAATRQITCHRFPFQLLLMGKELHSLRTCHFKGAKRCRNSLIEENAFCKVGLHDILENLRNQHAELV